MTVNELIKELAMVRGAYDYGKTVIDDLKRRGEAIPTFVYDRMIELADEILNEIDKRAANA